MKIDYLADHPEFLAPLAVWHHREWGYLRPGDTVEARIERLKRKCGRGGIPTALVAVEGDTWVGSASLVKEDMDVRPDLAPWLAGVFVHPDYRGRGVGSALVRGVINEARTAGVKRLYLYTTSERFYTRLGWSAVESVAYQGTEVVIMSCEL